MNAADTTDLAVLNTIEGHGGFTDVKAIAATAGMTRGHVASSLARLKRHGLVSVGVAGDVHSL